MENFTYYAPTKILFGKGQIANLRAELPAGARVLMTYGGGSIRRNGVYEQVKAAVQGFTVFEFGGIEPNPAYETLLNAINLARENRIDFLLAVGGGSVIDGTKFVAAALRHAGDPWTILANRASQAELTGAVPLGCVLTLPATGSEMNGGAVISRRTTGDKLAFRSPHVIPRFSVLDPQTTFSLPARQVANGVIDAFVHVSEQYLTFPAEAKVQDRFAEGLLQTLIEVGPQALHQPPDYAARANLMWAATMALNGLIGLGVPGDWASHMIGHELTAKHGLDHGQTLAIVLPAMLTVRREEKRAKLLQYAARVWGITEGSENARIDAAIAATRTFFEKMGAPTHLSAYGIGLDAVPSLLEKLKEHGMTALGEHQAVTLETSRKVLELAV